MAELKAYVIDFVHDMELQELIFRSIKLDIQSKMLQSNSKCAYIFVAASVSGCDLWKKGLSHVSLACMSGCVICQMWLIFQLIDMCQFRQR